MDLLACHSSSVHSRLWGIVCFLKKFVYLCLAELDELSSIVCFVSAHDQKHSLFLWEMFLCAALLFLAAESGWRKLYTTSPRASTCGTNVCEVCRFVLRKCLYDLVRIEHNYRASHVMSTISLCEEFLFFYNLIYIIFETFGMFNWLWQAAFLQFYPGNLVFLYFLLAFISFLLVLLSSNPQKKKKTETTRHLLLSYEPPWLRFTGLPWALMLSAVSELWCWAVVWLSLDLFLFSHNFSSSAWLQVKCRVSTLKCSFFVGGYVNQKKIAVF